ncbi:MAG: signal transduction histidine kinase [Chlamydiales bacterium]|jgi:signal transduction histidine kinase
MKRNRTTRGLRLGVRGKILLGISCAVFILAAQAIVTNVFVGKMQHAVVTVISIVETRTSALRMLDAAAAAQGEAENVCLSDAPLESLKALDVYWEEFLINKVSFAEHGTPMVPTSLTLKMRHEEARVISAIAELNRAMSTADSDEDAALDATIDIDDALSETMEALAKTRIRLDRLQATALAAEDAVHDLPVRAAWSIFGVSALILLAFAWAFASRLVRPIVELAGLANELADEHSVSRQADESGDDEIGMLGAAFNEMGRRVRDAIGSLENANRELEQDIIIRARLEKELLQAQKLEAIGQLAAGIAHELNTPAQYVGDNTRFLEETFAELLPLLGKAARLTEGTMAGADLAQAAEALVADLEAADIQFLSEEIPSAISQSLEGIARVSKIVLAMKEFSHPGGQGMVHLDINRAIESTITVASSEWRYVALLDTDLDPFLPDVPCLAGEFNQVILNMIVNAAHAVGDVVGDGSERGKISISTRQIDEMAEVRISDSGAGIPEEARGRIFDHFFTTKDVGRGTGQGLSMAHTVIVQKHSGTIQFETETGKGTTFIIRLPLEQESQLIEDAAS